MQKLQEIVRIVGRKRLKRIEIFNDGQASNRGSLYYKLYRGIKDGKFKTDEDAARELFGCEPSDKKYLMLKSRVKARLINSLFFLENSNSRYQQALYKTNRNFVAAKILLLNGAKRTGVAMLRSTLHEAEKFGITEVAVDCLRDLRYHSGFLGQENDFHKYNKRFKELQKTLQAEIRAEELYSLFSLHFANTFSMKTELAGQVSEYLEEIKDLQAKYDSLTLTLQFYRLKVLVNQVTHNFEEVIETTQAARNFLHENEHFAMKVRHGEFAYYEMVTHMHMGNYREGTQLANSSLHLFRDGSINWVIFQEYHFLLCMHTSNYHKAVEVFNTVVNHKRFNLLPENRKEKWRIFEGFLKYMTGSTESSGENTQSATNRFNIWKFLNEVPIYSKDKRGLNIAIIILQVLFLLDRQDYDGIISRAEALKVYCSRYLKQDENYRSNCFLKMVLIMEKKDFDKEETAKIAEKYFDKLRSAKTNYQSGNLATLEVIPYEQLWYTILDKLKG